MLDVYLIIFKGPKAGSNISLVPLETLIALHTIRYLKCSYVSLKLVLKDPKEEVLFEVDLSNVPWEIIAECQIPVAVLRCVLPAILVINSVGPVCVAGLSAALRQMVKTEAGDNQGFNSLLGFREGCLSACAETSLWTKFCEVDVPKATKEYVSKVESSVDDEFTIPVDLARFERHMEQPLRIHNIQKQKQDYAKGVFEGGIENTNSCNETNKDVELDHRYAENHYLTLADLILFPCLYIIFESAKKLQLQNYIPLVNQWLIRMLSHDSIRESAKIILTESLPHVDYKACSLPFVPNQSLYKSDPKRYKPRARLYTRQDEVEASLKLVSQMGVSVDWSAKPFGAEMECDWSMVPQDAHPLGGSLPVSRSERKLQQLENLVKAVLKVAKPGQTIVDFCSGSGHLGIVLAYFLPLCHVILLDNKDESLRRARDRVSRLAMDNVAVYQCNLDYFKGDFHVGVSLHACGVATDLVIQRCLEQGAVFICCPCCYGGVSDNHIVTYPRSKLFKSSPITLREYLVIGHSADQTHGDDNSKTEQGKQCMGIIDMDRCIQAKENGYQVHLSKLVPESCTPKNNLLVGLPGKN
ncbi:glutathione S-transferase C-terminal domain-containing protein homolog [Ischnura elegans]|uniref:glutathione S-transferase C-terminal domain-containing protein homolog n=1 Tax=Ischnura elegans TaxID=197161 RepID=UPI001ED8908C|nr:glutathione S-transferase C-terminal domain-containing protein homolog [Ischnura elegans]